MSLGALTSTHAATLHTASYTTQAAGDRVKSFTDSAVTCFCQPESASESTAMQMENGSIRATAYLPMTKVDGSDLEIREEDELTVLGDRWRVIGPAINEVGLSQFQAVTLEQKNAEDGG